MRLFTLALLTLPLPALADDAVDRVVSDFAVPHVTAFAETTAALAQAAEVDCTPGNAGLLAAWNAAMDAWLGVQDLRFGPLEQGSRRQAIAYWPDVDGHRPRALSRILTGQDPVLDKPETFPGQPISARGLYAVEAMLFDPQFNDYGAGDPGCVLVQAMTADLAGSAAAVQTAWQDDFVTVMRTAGNKRNARFLDASEARQVVFTALLTSMQFDIDERLGLPLGTFDRPRPKRAEGRLSGRSQRNLELSLVAHAELARALVPDAADAPRTHADFERVIGLAQTLDDPDFSGVDDPAERFKLETLQTALIALRADVHAELGKTLDVSMGLNSLDGD
ncbi:hypothetical protein SAMN05444339_10613 [Loktanella atrilutea]|uniref:Imelysin-like domain-containing protein n=1 Tax=Loktanella atrilutea TaxID=366533 RepID=A0A1M5BH87_LOKAT|nr:imelysin family protein [Loktanella atrilutea]SHF41825.1 hypothetical protein SAMN05444339_10613 [Loktanella atrilutea]